jgi:hypothetical protein
VFEAHTEVKQDAGGLKTVVVILSRVTQDQIARKNTDEDKNYFHFFTSSGVKTRGKVPFDCGGLKWRRLLHVSKKFIQHSLLLGGALKSGFYLSISD